MGHGMAGQGGNSLHQGKEASAGLDVKAILQGNCWIQITQRLKNRTGMGNMPEATPMV